MLDSKNKEKMRFLKVTKISVDGRTKWRQLKGRYLQMEGNKKQVAELQKALRTSEGRSCGGDKIKRLDESRV